MQNKRLESLHPSFLATLSTVRQKAIDVIVEFSFLLWHGMRPCRGVALCEKRQQIDRQQNDDFSCANSILTKRLRSFLDHLFFSGDGGIMLYFGKFLFEITFLRAFGYF